MCKKRTDHFQKQYNCGHEETENAVWYGMDIFVDGVYGEAQESATAK